MNERVTEAMATAMATEMTVAPKISHLACAKVLAEEVQRLQDWLVAISTKARKGPSEIVTPPSNLLRIMKRVEVYQEAAFLGYKEVGEMAAEALDGLPAPQWVHEDPYIDPDDEEDETENEH